MCYIFEKPRAKYDLLIIMTKKKNETNTKTKTNTQKKTKAKYRKDHTCAIFLKRRWRKGTKYDILSAHQR